MTSNKIAPLRPMAWKPHAPLEDKGGMAKRPKPPASDQPSVFAHLATWRDRAGLTQEAVAEMFQVSAVTIHRWETGKAPVTVQNYSKLADLYGAANILELTLPPSMQRDAADLRAAFIILRQMDAADRADWLKMGRRLSNTVDVKALDTPPE